MGRARRVRSVANLTRRDGEEFLALAPAVPVRTRVTEYPLERADDALDDLRAGRVNGSGVLSVRMKLYVCWGLFASPRPGGHPCKNAHDALKEAGHEPEVVKSYGLGILPDFLNQTPGRKEVKRLTGNNVGAGARHRRRRDRPGLREIAAWAKENPATQRA